MNKLEMLSSLTPTMEKENVFQLSSQYLLSLTYQDFNKFRQEDMIRMTKVPTTQTPSTTKPLLSTLQETRQDQSSYPSLLTYLMNQTVIPLKQHYLKKMSLILPHLQL